MRAANTPLTKELAEANESESQRGCDTLRGEGDTPLQVRVLERRADDREDPGPGTLSTASLLLAARYPEEYCPHSAFAGCRRWTPAPICTSRGSGLPDRTLRWGGRVSETNHGVSRKRQARVDSTRRCTIGSEESRVRPAVGTTSVSHLSKRDATVGADVMHNVCFRYLKRHLSCVRNPEREQTGPRIPKEPWFVRYPGGVSACSGHSKEARRVIPPPEGGSPAHWLRTADCRTERDNPEE